MDKIDRLVNFAFSWFGEGINAERNSRVPLSDRHDRTGTPEFRKLIRGSIRENLSTIIEDQWRSPEEPPGVDQYGCSERVLLHVTGTWENLRVTKTRKEYPWKGHPVVIGHYRREPNACWLSSEVPGWLIIKEWMPLPEPPTEEPRPLGD